MTTKNKRILKRLLSTTLAAVLCLGLLSTPAQAASGATLTNGMPVTEENILALIDVYMNGKEPGEKAKEAGFVSYTNGSTYDPNNPPYFGAVGLYGKECAKFAFAFWDDIFGDAPYREVTDPWQVRPGDLIHTPSHWYIAVKSAYPSPYPDFYTDPCTREVGGGSAGCIGWADGDKRLNTTNGTVIYTRYPLPYEFEDSEVHLTAEGPIGTPSLPSN